jgi:transposase
MLEYTLMKSPSKARRRKVPNTPSLPPQLAQVNLQAAGIDVGSQSHWVAVPTELSPEQPVREFGHFTQDLEALADWLVQRGVNTVAMESTGVYWISLFEVLEARGLEVLLVNARHVKNVPGRKSDVLDCQWLQQLHTFGLLRGAFRPPEQRCILRSYLRQRETLISSGSTHIQHMQKALTQMNLPLQTVVSDITGVSGMKIIHAILDGERDPQVLAGYRDKRCKHDEATIAKALCGH